jgi:long-chain acyl-CoA synthetase
MPIGYKMADLKFQKKKTGLFLKILYSLADIILFRSIRRSTGLSNARICYSNGAILSPDALKFYHALNLPLKSLYGTTEGGALTCARNDDIRLETVGPVHKGIEVKITENGEIIYRQPGTFIGYYKDPEKTAQVLKDGWFYSGDIGFIGEDGHIVFTDRLNDIVKLANGNKLAPQFIESRLRSSPYIKDAWVVAGKGMPYASVIIIINYNNVGRWAGQRRVAYSTFAELSQKPEVYRLVEQEIDRINSTLPPGSRVKKYVNLHKEFDPDEGELTRNRKLRKTFLEERYCELVNAIYSDQPETQIEAQIRYQDGRIGLKKTILMIKSVERDAL